MPASQVYAAIPDVRGDGLSPPRSRTRARERLWAYLLPEFFLEADSYAARREWPCFVVCRTVMKDIHPIFFLADGFASGLVSRRHGRVSNRKGWL